MMKIILFFITLVSYSKVSSASIEFTANKKYSYVGRKTINIPELIQLKNNKTNWHTDFSTVTLTFQRPASFSNLTVFVTIADLQMKNLNQGIDIFIIDYSATQTSVLIDIYAGDANNIIKLSISYIYLQKFTEYTGNMQFYVYDYFIDGLGLFISNSTPKNLTLIPGDSFNLTGGASIITFMNGMNLSAAGSYLTYDITIEGSVKNSSAMFFIFSSKSSTYTLLKQIYLTICVYNPQYMASSFSKYYRLYTGSITSPTLTNGGIQMTNFNTIVGLTSFSTSNNNYFNYSNLADTSGININTSLNRYVFTYFTILSKYCDYTTSYYYETSTSLCWTKCPGNSSTNDSSLTCSCYVNNILANNSICVSNTSNSTQNNISSNPTSNLIIPSSNNITSNPTSNGTIPSSNNLSNQKSQISLAMIIGIAVGLVIGLIATGIASYCCVKRYRKKSNSDIQKNPYIPGQQHQNCSQKIKGQKPDEFQLKVNQSQIKINQ